MILYLERFCRSLKLIHLFNRNFKSIEQQCPISSSPQAMATTILLSAYEFDHFRYCVCVCVSVCVCVCVLVAQSRLTLYDPMDCSLPGSSVHGILQAKNSRVGCHFLLQGIFLIPYITEIMQYLSFCSWIISISIMSSRFNHVVAFDSFIL